MNKQKRKIYLPAVTPIELNILLSLLSADRHGFGMIQEVAERTEYEVFLSPGTLYSALKRMHKAGWIEPSDDVPDPPNGNAEHRTYYRLTQEGQAIILAEIARMNLVVEKIRALQAEREAVRI